MPEELESLEETFGLRLRFVWSLGEQGIFLPRRGFLFVDALATDREVEYLVDRALAGAAHRLRA